MNVRTIDYGIQISPTETPLTLAERGQGSQHRQHQRLSRSVITASFTPHLSKEQGTTNCCCARRGKAVRGRPPQTPVRCCRCYRLRANYHRLIRAVCALAGHHVAHGLLLGHAELSW